MNNNKVGVIAGAVAAALAMNHALAETQLNLSGFGTVGAVHSDSRDADFGGSVYQPNGPGRSSPWMYGVDTKAGVQVSANFGNGLTGVAQLVADHRGNNSYSPNFEWLNLKYDINNNWYVRGGRVLLPIFMVSDTRNVGYSLTSVRMPMDVYFINPISHADGVDIGGKFDVAGGNLLVTLTAGDSNDVMKQYRIEGKKTVNLGATYETGSSTFHANYFRGRLSVVPYDNNSPGTIKKFSDYTASVNYLKGVPAAGYTQPNLLIDDLKASMWSFGYTYDPGTWVVQAEYAARKVDSLLVTDLAGWYVQAGYRLGRFTPYASVSQLKTRDSAPHPKASTAAGGLTALAATVVNFTDEALGVQQEEKSVALGVRYDLARNVDLKMQYDVIRKPGSGTPYGGIGGGGNGGTFKNVPYFSTWNYSEQTVKLFSVALDFVF